ncbi:MAG: hypothetical protein ACH34Y_07355 [Brachymonas sp.]
MLVAPGAGVDVAVAPGAGVDVAVAVAPGAGVDVAVAVAPGAGVHVAVAVAPGAGVDVAAVPLPPPPQAARKPAATQAANAEILKIVFIFRTPENKFAKNMRECSQ